MQRKKKQQALTLEELRVQIRLEKASYWLHSPPLYGLIKKGEEFELILVDPNLEKKILVIFILDPADTNSERVLEFIDVLKKRYPDLPWLPTLVFDQRYMFSKNPIFWDFFKKYANFNLLPIHMDSYGEFAEWAKIDTFTKAFFYLGGERTQEYILDGNLAKTFLQMETDLQQLLRVNDRGLPLPLLYEYELDGPVDRLKPKFSELTFNGHWIESPDNLMTEDHNATMIIPFEGKSLRLIASLHTTAREAASRVIVTFNDKSIPPAILSQYVIADSHGVTTFEVTRFQGIFDLFFSKEVLKGTIKLTFKNAAISPVVFWGCRVS